jgi:hypothetical protein
LVIFIIKYDRFAQFTTENIVTHSHDKFLEIGPLSKDVKEIRQFVTIIKEDDSSYAYAMKLKLVEMLFVYVENEIILRHSGLLCYYSWQPGMLIF